MNQAFIVHTSIVSKTPILSCRQFDSQLSNHWTVPYCSSKYPVWRHKYTSGTPLGETRVHFFKARITLTFTHYNQIVPWPFQYAFASLSCTLQDYFKNEIIDNNGECALLSTHIAMFQMLLKASWACVLWGWIDGDITEKLEIHSCVAGHLKHRCVHKTRAVLFLLVEE